MMRRGLIVKRSSITRKKRVLQTKDRIFKKLLTYDVKLQRLENEIMVTNKMIITTLLQYNPEERRKLKVIEEEISHLKSENINLYRTLGLKSIEPRIKIMDEL